MTYPEFIYHAHVNYWILPKSLGGLKKAIAKTWEINSQVSTTPMQSTRSFSVVLQFFQGGGFECQYIFSLKSVTCFILWKVYLFTSGVERGGVYWKEVWGGGECPLQAIGVSFLWSWEQFFMLLWWRLRGANSLGSKSSSYATVFFLWHTFFQKQN